MAMTEVLTPPKGARKDRPPGRLRRGLVYLLEMGMADSEYISMTDGGNHRDAAIAKVVGEQDLGHTRVEIHRNIRRGEGRDPFTLTFSWKYQTDATAFQHRVREVTAMVHGSQAPVTDRDQLVVRTVRNVEAQLRQKYPVRGR